MKLRKLDGKDASLMLEWMHDEDVMGYLSGNFLNKSIEDCMEFIRNSWSDSDNLHLAIINDCDEYLGTVSLKHINRKLGIAEFAITVRKKTMGTGIAAEAMAEIFLLGLKEYGLNKIYWCVNQSNVRAIKFYEKNKYTRIQEVPESIVKNYNEKLKQELIWYGIVLSEWSLLI